VVTQSGRDVVVVYISIDDHDDNDVVHYLLDDYDFDYDVHISDNEVLIVDYTENS
jgi:hypothetical protein